MGREKLSTNPVAAQRKKDKEKERKKCKAQRSLQYENQFVRRTETEVDKTVGELRSRQSRDALAHKEKGKLERIEKLLKKHGDKLDERWKKQSANQEKTMLQNRVDHMADIAIFSVYYDSVRNPYGIPPPGKPPGYRHPDGIVREDPPFQAGSFVPPPPPRKKRSLDEDASDSSSSSSRGAPPPPSCPPPKQKLPPGFSYNPTAQFQEEAKRLDAEREALVKASTPYRPPLPKSLPPIKNKPPLPLDPPPEHLLRAAREKTQKPSFEEVVAQAKREALEAPCEDVRAEIPGSEAAEVAEVAEGEKPEKPTSFVPTVLRTKQSRVSQVEQVSALSLAIGSENVRAGLTPAKGKTREKDKDMDAAFDSFMKEV